MRQYLRNMISECMAQVSVEQIFHRTLKCYILNTFFLLGFLFYYLFYLFTFGCIGSLLPCAGFLQLWRVRAILSCGVQASHCSGFSCRIGFSNCGTWVQQLWLAGSRAQAQQLWRVGLVALQHVGSSWTRARTRVPCVGRQILNHCATKEVLVSFFKIRAIVLSYRENSRRIKLKSYSKKKKSRGNNKQITGSTFILFRSLIYFIVISYL